LMELAHKGTGQLSFHWGFKPKEGGRRRGLSRLGVQGERCKGTGEINVKRKSRLCGGPLHVKKARRNKRFTDWFIEFWVETTTQPD